MYSLAAERNKTFFDLAYEISVHTFCEFSKCVYCQIISNSKGTKFLGLTTMDMFMDTAIHKFQIVLNIT